MSVLTALASALRSVFLSNLEIDMGSLALVDGGLRGVNFTPAMLLLGIPLALDESVGILVLRTGCKGLRAGPDENRGVCETGDGEEYREGS